MWPSSASGRRGIHDGLGVVQPMIVCGVKPAIDAAARARAGDFQARPRPATFWTEFGSDRRGCISVFACGSLGEPLAPLFDLVATVGGHSEGEVVQHFDEPCSDARCGPSGFDELIDRCGDVVIPGRWVKQYSRVSVGISDVADGKIAVRKIAQEATDRIDCVATCGRVVDGWRLGAQPDVNEQSETPTAGLAPMFGPGRSRCGGAGRRRSLRSGRCCVGRPHRRAG